MMATRLQVGQFLKRSRGHKRYNVGAREQNNEILRFSYEGLQNLFSKKSLSCLCQTAVVMDIKYIINSVIFNNAE
jgi:hypothetical protein